MELSSLGAGRSVVVYGSLAYDRVMYFLGRFRDHLLPQKLHVLSVSFAVPTVRESFGGTAGNIAYNLSLLGEQPHLYGSAGNDFTNYHKWLTKQGIATTQLTITKKLATAAAYIMTDRDDNQISAFSVGAMAKRCILPAASGLRHSLVIIAPGNPQDMVALARRCVIAEAQYLWDPGQQILQFSRADLAQCVNQAAVLIGNDYEISLIARKLGFTELSLLKKAPLAVRTLAARGSEIWIQGIRIKIPPVRTRVVDPTGAGDAYRAGFIVGLRQGWPLATVGRFASLVASYTVQEYGTQTHHFTWADLRRRYRNAFGQTLP